MWWNTNLLTSVPIFYFVSVEDIIFPSFPFLHEISQFERKWFFTAGKRFNIIFWRNKLCQSIDRYVCVYVHVVMIAECYVAGRERVGYGVGGSDTDHSIVYSCVIVGYSGVIFYQVGLFDGSYGNGLSSLWHPHKTPVRMEIPHNMNVFLIFILPSWSVPYTIFPISACVWHNRRNQVLALHLRSRNSQS